MTTGGMTTGGMTILGMTIEKALCARANQHPSNYSSAKANTTGATSVALLYSFHSIAAVAAGFAHVLAWVSSFDLIGKLIANAVDGQNILGIGRIFFQFAP